MSFEKNLNFDTIVERRNTNSIKYDFAEQRGKSKDVLPLWVADMDFKTSSFILEALEKSVDHGIFGYTETRDSYFEALSGWMKRRHNWDINKSWLIKTPGVVFAIAAAVRAYSKAGDGVLIQQPVYYPFSEVIKDNNREVVSNDLVLGEDGKYHIDFEDFERKIVENKIPLFILCSPHNPIGRVWTKEELIRIGEICLKHNVIIVSDEIHEDFVFGKVRHQVFADLREDFREITITCTSPGKTFNLAGLQISNIFIPNESLRVKFQNTIKETGYSQLNTLGLVACEAAYRDGDAWYEAMIEYIEGNVNFVEKYLEENIPQVKMILHEGTYLVWLDFRELAIDVEKLENLISNEAKLWLDGGTMFGPTGAGFQRINVACPRNILQQALSQLKVAIDNRIK